MAQIVWAEPALNELDKIAEFIALDKFDAAQKLVQSVYSHVKQLKLQPQSGRVPSELPQKSIYREVMVGPCRVFYRTEKSRIIIIYVMRSECILRKFILEGRSGLSS